jgi:glycosyltransferase involved in cell wall biosynthesis
MKLLHVISGMDPRQGGVCQAVRNMITGLAEYNVHSEVVCLDAPDAPWSKKDLFPIHALGPSQGPWNYSSKLTPWLLANFSHFDAIILHGLWLYQGYALRKALRRFKARHQLLDLKTWYSPKFFIMPHGMLDPYFQRATGRKLKAWRNWVYWKVIEGSIVNEADGLLFTCETERRLAHQPFVPYHPQREIVVGLGIEEPPPYTPAMREAFLAECPGLDNRPYLLFLSRIHEKKGVEILLQAYAQRVRDLILPTLINPPPDEYNPQTIRAIPALVIAGPGLETSYGQTMKELAAKLPEPATVFFPGMLTGNAKWGAFYGCEAFILPSHQENFGIAVVEALACSKPVLISNQVNIWREIEETGGGIVANNTLEGTHSLLVSWCKLSESERQVISEKARASYQRYFAIRSASEKTWSALQ